MIANATRFGRRIALVVGLAIAGLSFAAGIAAADDPFSPVVPDPGLLGSVAPNSFVPTLPDPSQITNANPLYAPQPLVAPQGIAAPEGIGTPSNSVNLLSGTGQQLMPLLTDATKFLNFSQDPSGYVGALQNLLNDGGNLLGVPSAGSFMPQMPMGTTDPSALVPSPGF
jgi:hypothetical protein